MSEVEININDGELKYAGFWIRNWAVFIDSMIILFMVLIFFSIFYNFIDAKEFGQSFSLWVMDFLTQKMQETQGMPIDSQNSIDSLSQQLSKLDASFTTIFLPAQIIFSAFYYAIPESSRLQGSLGKHLMGIKIVNLNGERISFFRAMARNLVKIIPQYINFFLYIIVYLTIPFDKRKRGIHDMICKTYVVYK